MCTFVAEFLTLQNRQNMTTDFMEDWPHEEVRLRLEMNVNADELEELYSYFNSAELSEYKNSEVYEEFMDLLLLARKAFKYYKEQRYRDYETD